MLPLRFRNPISIVALALILGGCSVFAADDTMLPSRVTRLVVENRGWENVTVTVVRGGSEVRIGIVDGLSTRVFLLPAAATAAGVGLQLRGRGRISNESFTSHVFDMVAGDLVHWTIETLPSLSHVTVR